jgi:hypothetical protein
VLLRLVESSDSTFGFRLRQVTAAEALEVAKSMMKRQAQGSTPKHIPVQTHLFALCEVAAKELGR